MNKEYAIAGHVFSVSADYATLDLMKNYEPFAVMEIPLQQQRVFSLSINAGKIPSYSEELRQVEGDQTIICGKTSEGLHVFEFQWNGISTGILVCSDNYSEGHLILTGIYKKSTIDNALMIMYALATADKYTVLFHAAVVSCEGKAYMFLGPSGTGKSTHARLWLQHIEGTDLVNDDNPVVRISENGQIMVYGSPWSGKTPCYRNVSYPLTGMVKLTQAPYNKIIRLSKILSYTVLRQSISGMRWDKRIADGLHKTENELTKTVAFWHLECLPDKDAAEICHNSIFASES